jgi:hypothetical protein
MAITQERLKEVLTYAPDTGVFYWAKKTCAKVVVGKEAGCISPRGYRHIRIDGTLHLAHRLAWLFSHGSIPDGMQVDHINRDKSDNRISNLRLATNAENARNQDGHRRRASAFKGVFWDKTGKNWGARICVDRTHKYLGGFPTEKQAAAAYDRAAAQFHGEFAVLNEAA